MQRFIKYPSIEQFRHITKQIQEHACYIGKDADNQPIFDYLKSKPTLTFLATEKIHGTNAAVCYSIPDGMWAQSRERILSMESDNMGFCFFALQKELMCIGALAEQIDPDYKSKIYADCGSMIYSIYKDNYTNIFKTHNTYYSSNRRLGVVYMPKDVAEKVCEILNNKGVEL